MTNDSEAVLSRSLVDRNARIRQIVVEHYDFVWRSLRHLGLSAADADDAAQQVLIVASQKLELILVGRERSFLFATAMRIASRWRRSRGRRREVDNSEDILDQQVSRGWSAAEQAPARALLERILQGMPEDMRIVFMLYEVEQFTMSEIATLLDVPTGTVASRLRRGREHFREVVSRLEGQGTRVGGDL